jgi:hypothetical protein
VTPGIDTNTLEDAKLVLRQVRVWRLNPEAWSKVRESVDRIYVALGQRDETGLDTATRQLESLAPSRLSPVTFGDEPIPAPEPFLEYTNQLVHSLSSVLASPRSSADSTN